MEVFKYFLFVIFTFCPFLSLASNPPTQASLEQCRSDLNDLISRREGILSDYNEQQCSHTSSADCVQWNQTLMELRLSITDKDARCRRISIALENRRVDDAKGRVDKQSDNTDMLSMLSKMVGTGLLMKGMACCRPHCKGGCPLIPIGLAGLAMGGILGKSSDKLDDTSKGFDDSTELCPSGNCSPPPPPPGGSDPPSPTSLGTGLLGVPGGPTLPNITNCEPSCPCPVPSGATPPPNCQITKDEDGNPKMTYGPDKDKDGFGDEEITAADARKVNQNDPKIQAAIAAAKAPYADMFAELEKDMAGESASNEELLADAGGTGGEGFLSGGGTRAGRSPGVKGGSGRRPRKDTDDDVNKAVQGLMAQFMNKKKKKAGGEEAKLFGDSQIGVAQDNIFMMVHRRYQERRGENEFIE